MSSRRLFISDLHIDQSRTDIIYGLFQFLERNKNRCEALYILGDLFEVWIGDDAIADTEMAVASKLRDFSQHGASVFIMHGNRDFLIGNEYANQCGATIIYDNHLVKIEDENSKETSTYQIVGEFESDIIKKKLSINSPLARGLIGKVKNDIVEINSPKGIKVYKVISVKYV